MYLNSCKFHEFRCSESHTLEKGVYEILPVVSTFFQPIWNDVHKN